MALINNTPDISALASVDASGFKAATFVEIKDALINSLKSIYGDDIDVSDASADGQYIMSQALLINNIYRTLESMQKNLSIASASGTFLDTLANLSGITRYAATQSTAWVYIKNISASDVTTASLVLKDTAGNQWVWLNKLALDGTYKVTFKAGKTTLIEVTCKETGAISALGSGDSQPTFESTSNRGAINTVVGLTSLIACQCDDATLGEEEESDSELRSRRIRSFGRASQTLAESLQASLYNIPTVKDVLMYVNSSNEAATPITGLTIEPHSIATVVAQTSDVDIKNQVFNTLYYGLTPGIGTYFTWNGVAGAPTSTTIQLAENLTQSIQYIAANRVSPTVTVDLSLVNNTTAITQSQADAIATVIKNYLDSLKIAETPNLNILSQLIMSVDYRTAQYGLNTYTVDSSQVSINTMLGAFQVYNLNGNGSVKIKYNSAIQYTVAI